MCSFDIFKGPPGCGKTTSIWALAREMLGDRLKSACLELNASDDRYFQVLIDFIAYCPGSFALNFALIIITFAGKDFADFEI